MILSLLAMAANVAKVLSVKLLCRQVDSRLLVLSSRVFSAVLLIPLLLFRQGGIPMDGLFWATILLTASITAVASILMTEAMQKGLLAVVMPIQAAVPVFMLITLWLLFEGEHPDKWAVLWMLLSMIAVGFTLYASYTGQKQTHTHFRFALYSLAAAVLFGFSTVMDRVAIGRVVLDGWLAYSACWNVVSSVILGGECLRKRTLRWSDLRPSAGRIVIYSLSVAAAFALQQWAVQESLRLDGAIVNVKAIVTLHMPVIVLFGFLGLHERVNKTTLIGGLLAILFGVLLMWTM